MDDEIFIFELLFHITQSRGENIIDVDIFVDFGTLFYSGDFQVFDTAAETMADAGADKWLTSLQERPLSVGQHSVVLNFASKVIFFSSEKMI